MDDRDFYIGLLGLFVGIVLLALAPYGTYTYGRFVERRLLTQYFQQMTSDTYYDGFKDGIVAGKKSIICPEEEVEDGRY